MIYFIKAPVMSYMQPVIAKVSRAAPSPIPALDKPCSVYDLLMIQQVLSIDEGRPADLDYYAEPEQPNGVVYDLELMNDEKSALKDQEAAENG